MTWFDSLRALTGDQSDPIQEMKDYANRQQAQNRAAIGMDANGNPLPADAAAGAPQPLSPSAQATVAAHAASTLPPGQQPNATKSDPSLGATIMDLARYEQREQGFNQAMGGAFASVSQPRNRDWVKGIFNVNPIDAAKYGQTMMDVSSQQQGQDRSNLIGQMVNDPKQGPLIAQKMGMDWDTLKIGIKADPGMAGKIATALGTPTDMMRNAGQIAIQMKAQGAPQEAIDRTVSLIQTGMLPDVARPMAMAEIAWKRDHGNQPLPWTEGDPASFTRYNATVAAREDQRQEALGKRPGVEGKLNEIETQLDDIEKNPALAGLMEKMTPTTGSWSMIATGPAERALAQQIDQLASEKYVEGLSDPNMGNRKTQQEMTYVGKALSGVLNARNIKLPDFIAGLNRLKERVYETHANSYGESGDFTGMDSKYNGYLNDAYREGPLSEGIKNAPKRQPLDEGMLTWYKNGRAQGRSKSDLIHILRNKNYDTKELQKESGE